MTPSAPASSDFMISPGSLCSTRVMGVAPAALTACSIGTIDP
jgi:hypothetical protein